MKHIAGMGPTCFCPLRLGEFRRRYGQRLSRTALAEILASPDASQVKNDWMEFKRQLLLELARDLRATVHPVNPRIRLGRMLTCVEISALAGRDVRELVEAFAGDLPPLVRPGPGCYADVNRLSLIQGLTETVDQAHCMPPDAAIQAEVDFDPHALFNKSAECGFDFQIKANLACGLRKIHGGNHADPRLQRDDRMALPQCRRRPGTVRHGCAHARSAPATRMVRPCPVESARKDTGAGRQFPADFAPGSFAGARLAGMPGGRDVKIFQGASGGAFCRMAMASMRYSIRMPAPSGRASSCRHASRANRAAAGSWRSGMRCSSSSRRGAA